jgi:iron-sulfur cluster assembly protein CyaY
MTENDFNQRIDDTMEALEYALDEVDDDLDYQAAGGVLTVTFSNGTTMVFSRQPPTKQLWFAARSGGYHYVWDNEAGDWRDTRSGQLFHPFVVEQILLQAGVPFSWGEAR